jgi:hypothetical protein
VIEEVAEFRLRVWTVDVVWYWPHFIVTPPVVAVYTAYGGCYAGSIDLLDCEMAM